MMSGDYESSPDFFEAKYRKKNDPWNFAGSSYELSRYDAIMAALSPRRFRRAFEPGCSIGVLTQRVAGICEAVEAVDFSPTAVAHARERCARLPNVEVRCGSLSECLSLESFDLAVLSEIGYYFKADEWSEIVMRLVRSMLPGTTVLAAHWLGISADHHMSGDEVHSILASNSLLRLEHEERHEAFRLDRWVRV